MSLAACILATPASAITGSSQFFEKLDVATFGGSGIPNDPVAYSVFDYDGGATQLTLALSATQRFDNPPLTSDSATRSYTATTGSNIKGTPPFDAEGALWNFNFYVSVVSTLTGSDAPVISDFDIRIDYEFDPAENSEFDSSFGELSLDGGLLDADIFFANDGDPNTSPTAFATATVVQDSTNLLFGFLADETLTNYVVSSPSTPHAAFDPNATGQYSFRIREGSNNVVMNVNVVPVPMGLPLIVGAMGIAAAVSRRGRKAA
ncbi:MAG: hypothetical protein AAF368_13285 [Planctomycetota bacterium]